MKTTIAVCNRSLGFVKKNLSLVIFFMLTFSLILYSDIAYSGEFMSSGGESCYVTVDYAHSSVTSQRFTIISESSKKDMSEKKLVIDQFDGAECLINKEDFEKIKDATAVLVVDDV